MKDEIVDWRILREEAVPKYSATRNLDCAKEFRNGCRSQQAFDADFRSSEQLEVAAQDFHGPNLEDWGSRPAGKHAEFAEIKKFVQDVTEAISSPCRETVRTDFGHYHEVPQSHDARQRI